MNSESEYSYLVRIEVGAKNFSILIRNNKEVPEGVIEIMAKERINKYINESYANQKSYRSQTSESYFNKMIKQSSYDVEPLHGIEVYDINLKFSEEKIINESNGREIIKQSKFNQENPEGGISEP